MGILSLVAQLGTAAYQAYQHDKKTPPSEEAVSSPLATTAHPEKYSEELTKVEKRKPKEGSQGSSEVSQDSKTQNQANAPEDFHDPKELLAAMAKNQQAFLKAASTEGQESKATQLQQRQQGLEERYCTLQEQKNPKIETPTKELKTSDQVAMAMVSNAEAISLAEAKGDTSKLNTLYAKHDTLATRLDELNIQSLDTPEKVINEMQANADEINEVISADKYISAANHRTELGLKKKHEELVLRLEALEGEGLETPKQIKAKIADNDEAIQEVQEFGGHTLEVRQLQAQQEELAAKLQASESRQESVAGIEGLAGLLNHKDSHLRKVAYQTLAKMDWDTMPPSVKTMVASEIRNGEMETKDLIRNNNKIVSRKKTTEEQIVKLLGELEHCNPSFPHERTEKITEIKSLMLEYREYHNALALIGGSLPKPSGRLAYYHRVLEHRQKQHEQQRKQKPVFNPA